MEFAKTEMNVIEETVQQAASNDIRELSDLQLALGRRRHRRRARSLTPIRHPTGATQMEFAKTEMNVIEETVQQAASNDIRELSDLQLALVGGGIGDVLVL